MTSVTPTSSSNRSTDNEISLGRFCVVQGGFMGVLWWFKSGLDGLRMVLSGLMAVLDAQ